MGRKGARFLAGGGGGTIGPRCRSIRTPGLVYIPTSTANTLTYAAQETLGSRARAARELRARSVWRPPAPQTAEPPVPPKLLVIVLKGKGLVLLVWGDPWNAADDLAGPDLGHLESLSKGPNRVRFSGPRRTPSLCNGSSTRWLAPVRASARRRSPAPRRLASPRDHGCWR
jgi:hypothetical protein